MKRSALTPIAAPALLLLAGCVQVQLAQDKPLDINLNVNIKQEVVVTLKGDAQSLIKNNPGVF